jgi:hypothetical protein
MGGHALGELVPFGAQVQAKVRSWRRPEGLGRKPQWSAITKQGVVLGPPEDTLNGMAVLMHTGEIVVASSIFVTADHSAVAELRPKYRLKEKTAPGDVVVRKAWVQTQTSQQELLAWGECGSAKSTRVQGKKGNKKVGLGVFEECSDISGTEKVPEDSAQEVEVELPVRTVSDKEFLAVRSLATETALHLREVQDMLTPSGPHAVAGVWLRVANMVAAWLSGLEQLEAQAQPVPEKTSAGLRVLRDVPLGAEDLDTEQQRAQDLFLQTKCVSQEEVRQELTEWLDSMTKEYNSLVHQKQAVERIHQQDLQKKMDTGEVSLLLPAKAVFTRKAGAGVRKSRFCVCGSWEPKDPAGESVYAGGTEAVTVRVALARAARLGWTVTTGDVRTAFLNAPMPADLHDRIAVKPPPILVAAGLVPSSERWLIRRALYGLRGSPRYWGLHRDATLRTLKWQHEGQEYHLTQCLSDLNAWKVCKADGSTVGLVLCYVDDLLVMAEPGVVPGIHKAVQSKWEVSPWEDARQDGGTKYCGLTIFQEKDLTVRVGQKAYIEELLARHEVKTGSPTPMAAWQDPEPELEPSLADVRAAQGITGELTWLVTRSRPDIMFAVQQLSRFTTKSPKLVVSAGRTVLEYLFLTKDLELVYTPTCEPLGLSECVAKKRSEEILEIQADASHAPLGGRSQHAVTILYCGCLLAWDSGRQSITALSSAESEIIACMHGLTLGECILPLISELSETEVSPTLYTDNMAALAVISGEGGNWKSRHLKMRAAGIRERVESKAWEIYHIAGKYNTSDLGTKALQGPRIRELLELLNMRGEAKSADRGADPCWADPAVGHPARESGEAKSADRGADPCWADPAVEHPATKNGETKSGLRPDPEREAVSGGTPEPKVSKLSARALKALVGFSLVQQLRAQEPEKPEAPDGSEPPWELLGVVFLCVLFWELGKWSCRKVTEAVRLKRVATPSSDGVRETDRSYLQGEAGSVPQVSLRLPAGAFSGEQREVQVYRPKARAKSRATVLTSEPGLVRPRTEDYWEVSGDVATRYHVKLRRQLFSPIATVNPVGFNCFLGERTTKAQFVNGRVRELRDDFRAVAQPHRALEESWVGSTSFALRPAPQVSSSSGTSAVHSALPGRNGDRNEAARDTQGPRQAEATVSGGFVVSESEEAATRGQVGQRSRRCRRSGPQ